VNAADLLKRARFFRLLHGILAAALVGVIYVMPVADRIENQFALGLLYMLRQPVETPPGAVVVALDRRTLDHGCAEKRIQFEFAAATLRRDF
jgi:hypothetical protein